MRKFLEDDARNLHYVVFRMHRRLRNESLHESPLTVSEETVLLALSAQPNQTGAELARFQRITPQSTNMLVKNLTRRGYILSHKSSLDRRRKELVLTDLGQRLISAIELKRLEWIQEKVDAELTAEEANTVLKALPLLRRLVDRPLESAEKKLLREH